MRWKQNDFRDLTRVEPDGCLMMSLVDIAAEDAKKEPSKADIAKIHRMANMARYLCLSYGNQVQDGAFVLNHVGVLNIASEVLGKNTKWQYIARIYQPHTKGQSFNTITKYWKEADAVIVEVKTPEGGHFLRFAYDPWKEPLDVGSVTSVRYYRKER